MSLDVSIGFYFVTKLREIIKRYAIENKCIRVTVSDYPAQLSRCIQIEI